MAKIKSRFAVVWVDSVAKKVMVEDVEGQRFWGRPTKEGSWSDPIGAAYTQWQACNKGEHCMLMLETAIDLTMQGYDLAATLREFAKVDCFYDMGRESIPMCRALTAALLGKCLEPNTMSFDELMKNYRREDA